MLKKVSTDLNFNAREGEVLDFWKKNDIFKKSMKLHEGAQRSEERRVGKECRL